MRPAEWVSDEKPQLRVAVADYDYVLLEISRGGHVEQSIRFDRQLLPEVDKLLDAAAGYFYELDRMLLHADNTRVGIDRAKRLMEMLHDMPDAPLKLLHEEFETEKRTPR